MASEQVRLANKVLGPLLRRQGTSPAVGAALRRAVCALDKALVETHGPNQVAAIQSAISELQGCQSAIQQSVRPADQKQLEGTTQALAFLLPLAVPRTPAPPPPPPPPPPPTPPPPPPPPPLLPPSAPEKPKINKQYPSTEIPATESTDIPVRMMGLRSKLRLLHVVLNDPLTSLGDFAGASLALEKQFLALKWLEKKRITVFLDGVQGNASLEEKLAACMALSHLGDPSANERILTLLENRTLEKASDTAICAVFLHAFAHTQFLEKARDAFHGTSNTDLQALLLPLLAEHGYLSTESLNRLMDHVNEDLAVSATQALAWTGLAHDASIYLSLAKNAATSRRAGALLFTATVLGSRQALPEIRNRLRQDGHFPDPQLVDALAISGDRTDAALLLDLASHREAAPAYLLLAAANLGCMDTLLALPAFGSRVSGRILAVAERMIVGDRKVRMSLEPELRTLHGQPWSVWGLLDRLVAHDETVQSLRRLALELRTRTGIAPPSDPPLRMPTSTGSDLHAGWKGHYAVINRKLSPGHWYYKGKPSPR